MSDSIEEEVVGKSDKVTVRLIHDTDIKQTQVRGGRVTARQEIPIIRAES